MVTYSRPARIQGTAWLLAFAFTAGLVHAAPPPKKITVGTLELKYCNSDFDGYCGSIRRKLDPTGSVNGNITIGFEWYPRFDQGRPALGVFLPQEGGPGVRESGG